MNSFQLVFFQVLKSMKTFLVHLFFIWILIIQALHLGNSGSCNSLSKRCEMRTDKLDKLLCNGGFQKNYLNSTSVHPRIIVICQVTSSSFDPAFISNFPQLYRLSLINSPNISKFTQPFPNHRLQVLNLTRLGLVHLHHNTFEGLKHLRILDLSHNKLKQLDRHIVEHLSELQQIFLRSNNWDCDSHLKWVLNPLLGKKLMDANHMTCGVLKYKGKPVLAVMSFIKISDISPLLTNPKYLDVSDIYLDENQISNIDKLEGADWLTKFRVFSLRSNKLTAFPTFALENGFRKNGQIGKIYFGNNPWICDCTFTPSFKDFIIKYTDLIEDIDDIRCAFSEDDDNSLKVISELKLSSVCGVPSSFLSPLDCLNVLLICLIIFVILKLLYDYWLYKSSGKLPWIITKIP
ncbi:protein singed wings 2 isoform X4 [Halyomorpha halys]|uniref:protein singed wings 2 isoform X4 n=1 Tax=Halyomorpha halys TaxID=286706 RepID=UPI0006D4D526|nr:protein singed wings 2 isoform X4 [Halyomorpha halys]